MKYTNAEKRAKVRILRHWGHPGGSPLKDNQVCRRICAETGWSVPGKKHRKAMMLRYWSEVIRGVQPTATSAKPVSMRKKFYQSENWRAVRYEALKLHSARCQCCGASGRNGKVIHVDHIKPRSKYPELALVLSNLQVLCEDCNLGKMARDETDWRPTDGDGEHPRVLQ